jgi:GT2 family glycosyltransferase
LRWSARSTPRFRLENQDEIYSMSCTIVIPHLDRLDQLRWTLRSLKFQTTDFHFEVIVVDDGSKALPQDYLGPSDLPADIRFINQSNKGAGSARNAGWSASTQDIIIFLDCDQIVSPRFVEHHMAMFQKTSASFVQLGTRRHLKPTYQIDLKTVRNEPCRPDERIYFFRKVSFNLANHEIAWHLGFSHNMSIRRKDLVRCGGFDESFTGWGFEDCELTYRMKCAGVPPVLNPGIETCHQFHDQRISPQKFQRWLENLTYFMQKYPNSEVDSQKALIPACDPSQRPRLSWTTALLRMESVLRLGVGRPLQSTPSVETRCLSLEDLHRVATSEDCAQRRAVVAPQNFDLFLQSQLDPALKEVRLFLA